MANLVTATAAAAPSTGKLEAPARIHSIDLIRGAVMVFMAIDHVRVYSGVPAGGPMPGVFFTRWITHFCAPAFIFLAGTSSFFYGRKHSGLSKFLLTRGAWLIFLEFTVLRFAWTFNFDFRHYEMAGVLWAIGCCMIIMSVLVKLPVPAIGTIGLLIIAAHNLLDPFLRAILQGKAGNEVSALWKLAYVSFYAGPIHLGELNLIVLYSIIPWIGVMAAGYAFGQVLLLEPTRRNRLCLMIGGSAIVLFMVLRGFNFYGDPFPWHHGTRMPALLAFLNTTKYPASLNFLLMTLGPAIALVPLLQRANGALARMITVFGRVPFFYYVLHIPLIHLLALLVSRIRFGAVDPWLFANHPMGNPPPPSGYVWSLPLLYLVWAITIAVLYFPCRWFATIKAARRSWWLQYL